MENISQKWISICSSHFIEFAYNYIGRLCW